MTLLIVAVIALGVAFIIVSEVVAVRFERRRAASATAQRDQFNHDAVVFGIRIVGAVMIAFASIALVIRHHVTGAA